MMTRRQFVTGTATAALAAPVPGCGGARGSP